MFLFGKNRINLSYVIGVLMFILTNASAQKKSLSYQQQIQLLQAGAEDAYQKGYNDKAVALYNQAISLAAQAKDISSEANLLVESSNLNFSNGNSSEAIYYCSKALKIIPKSSLDSTRFKAFSNLSYFYSTLYKNDSAQYYYSLADRLLEQKPVLVNQTPMYVAAYYNQHGMDYNNIGDFSQAEINFQKALHVAYQYKLEALYTYLENNLSGLYVNLGKYDQALAIALPSLKNSKEKVTTISYLINISHIYFLLNKFPQVKLYLTKAQNLINLYKKEDVKEAFDSEPMLWRNWGQYYAAIDQNLKALSAYNRSLELGLRRWGKHHTYLSLIYRDKAKLLQKQNDLTGALNNYRYAMNAVYIGSTLQSFQDLPDLNNGIISEPDLLESLIGQAAVLRQLPNQNLYLKPSFQSYQLALELAERIRLNYDVADTKLLFGQQIAAVSEEALSAAFDLYQKTKQPYYLKQAFHFTESTRGSTLSDARREQALKKTFVPEPLRIEESQLKSSISALKVQLMQPLSEQEKKPIKYKMLEEELKLDKLRQKLRKFIPLQQLRASQPVQIATLQKDLLDPTTALLSYVMTARSLYAFVITSQQVKWVEIPFGPNERNVIAHLQQCLYDNPGLDPYKGHKWANLAYNSLFQPIKAFLSKIDRLIIIRDKELNYLPFEVLEQSTSGRDYLLKNYSIRYAYGASMAQIQQINGLTRGTKQALAMAPFSDSSVQKNPMRDKSLNPLPASLEEIQAVGGTQFVNKGATKAEFLDHYKAAEVIHLATHARTDDKEAERSFIAFYPNNHNYKLYTDELYNLSFSHTQMVVLSACETGRGRLHRGEGLMSLARGFLYGGCPSVVTTLWNAHDQSSAFLSERLYFHLHQGLPIDQALQKAKLDFFASPLGASYDHPYFWANLVLIGDASVVYQSHWTNIGRIALGFTLLGGIFLLIFLARHRLTSKK
ncbi:CHAT domain-containing protein [Siphonobacter sp. BAB-5404]|nr:CHAT domain-containing protein [Siphonobacter sp. SORGH_AS_0500]